MRANELTEIRIMDKPLISLIVPVYNTKKYLSKCIDSIISQNFANFELILINDGSSDGSDKICDEYATIDSRIHVFHRKNSGVSATRNFGIEKAAGTWCLFIDSDDYIDPHYLDSFFYALNDSIYFYIGKGFYVEYLNRKSSQYSGIPFDLHINSFVDIYILGEIYHVINSPCMKLFSLDIIRKNNIHFNTSLSLGEDHIFVLDYLLVLPSFQMRLIENSGYRYVKDETRESLTTRHKPYEQLFLYATQSYLKRTQLADKYSIENSAFQLFIKSESKSYIVLSLLSLLSSQKEKDKKYTEYKKIRNYCMDIFFKIQTSPYCGVLHILGYILDYTPARISYYILPFLSDIIKKMIYIKHKYIRT